MNAARATDRAVTERESATGARRAGAEKGGVRPPTTGSLGVRSLLRLQASAGNGAVSTLLRRRRQVPLRRAAGASRPARLLAGPALPQASERNGSAHQPLGGQSVEMLVTPTDVRDRPFDLIQRQAVAECPPPAPPPTPVAPQADPKFAAVAKSVETKAAKAKAHPPAKAEVKKAQDAAVPPTDDKMSQAKAAQADKMAAAKPGSFDKVAFVAAVKKAIAASAPKTLDDADKFANSGKADGVKAEVMSKVSKGKEESGKEIADQTKAPPDPSVAKEKPVVPLTESKAALPGDPKVARAMPDKAPAEQTNLGADKCETDSAMAKEGVTEEQLEKSNEPQFQAAVSAKKEGEAHSATAPAAVRATEAEALQQAKASAASKGAGAIQGMGAAKTGAISKVGSQKDAAKSKDEAARAQVAADINAIYDETKTAVEKIVTDLDAKVDSKFNTGEAEAKRAFTQDHTTKMKAWKDKRYEGASGAVQWGIDLFKDLPPEANQIFENAKKVYEQRMEAVINDVADLIGKELDAAKARIDQGRAKIKAYVASKPKNLRQVAQEAAAGVEEKFEQLQSDVDSKKEQLVSDLAEKYVEAKTKVDDEVKALQAENKGLWSKAKEAVGEAIETIKKLKDMLLGVLARAAGAIDKIIKDPIGFLGNLVNAVKAGVMGFASRIGEHLKKGLQAWLFGELAKGGIELPEKFDLKGILKLVLSLLGLTYANIRGRAVAIVGEKVVSRLEQVAEVFKILVTEGPAGLWKFVVDKVGDIKEQVMSQIKEFVITKVVMAGITWLISLLNPASAFVKACKAIVDIVMFLVNKAGQIKEFVDSVLDSVEAIAAGGAGKVAGLIEGTLAKMVPVLIGFLASLLGLGGISEKIKSVLAAIQAPVNKAIDWVIKGALKLGKKLFGKAKGLFEKGKAALAKGKAYVKGKVAAVKKWTQDKLRPESKSISMSGEGHQVILTPGPASKVELASVRSDLVGQLSAEASAVKRLQPARPAQLAAVQALLGEARALAKSGSRVDETKPSMQAKLAQLSSAIEAYARKYKRRQLNGVDLREAEADLASGRDPSEVPPGAGDIGSKEARKRFGKVRDDYAEKLDVAKGGQVHHSIELQVLAKYPGVFTEAELNDFTNMRGIGPELGNKRQLHNSKIREILDRAYERLDGQIAAGSAKMVPGNAAYETLVRTSLENARKEVDHALDAFFSEYRAIIFAGAAARGPRPQPGGAKRMASKAEIDEAFSTWDTE